MPRWLLFAGSFFALVGAIFCGMLIYGYFSASSDTCIGYPVMTLNSKDQGYRAEVQNNTCSTDGSLRTVVNLSKLNSTSDVTPKSWSAFIASSAAEVNQGIYVPLQLQIQWLSDSEIEISFPYGTKVLSRAGVAHGVSVQYRELSAP